VRRLIKRQRETGDAALAHGNHGHASTRRLDAGLPEPIHISRSTLRTICRAEREYPARANDERPSTAPGAKVSRRQACCCKQMASAMIGWKAVVPA